VSVVFADSGYWIALWNPRDALHPRSMAAADGSDYLSSCSFSLEGEGWDEGGCRPWHPRPISSNPRHP